MPSQHPAAPLPGITRAAPAAPRAKLLPRALPVVSPPPDLIPARMINEVLYCERLLFLEWVQGEFTDNVFTVEGRAVHKRADVASGDLPPPPTATDEEKPVEASGDAKPDDDADADEPAADDASTRPYEARSLWLSSEALGMTAKIDVVEGDASGTVVPIEYKRGAAPDLPEGAYLPERAQVCAQALLLREHGYRCESGAIYFARSRRRVPIAIDDSLVRITLGALQRVRDVAARAEMPPPLVDSPKCSGCSLVGICLPDEVTLLRRLDGVAPEDLPVEIDRTFETSDLDGPLADDPWGLAGPDDSASVAEIRRLHAAHEEKLPVYVQEQGARVALDGDRLVIRGRETGTTYARLPQTSQVVLYGNVQVSTQALRELLVRGIPLSFFSGGGWYYGRASGVESKNVDLRLAQHRGAVDPALCLRLARGFVVSKIKNGRTMLRRNHAAPPPAVLSELDQLARKAEQCDAIESLLGLEGTAARVYFGAFTGMLKQEAAVGHTFDLDGRNRRPPRDPINALLSFAYSLLTKDFAVTASAVGLDPLLGFYHRPRFGRPALALDLMEEFRPIVADSVVLGVLNNGTVTATDFVVRGAGVALEPDARKKLIYAYERRMDQLVTHPVFGYRLSYRRVLEVQARLLGRLLLGEIEAYPAFRTR